MNTLSVCQDEFFISWRRKEMGGAGPRLEKIALPSLAGKVFVFRFFFGVFCASYGGSPSSPRGATRSCEKYRTTGHQIIHPLHLLFSASFFSFIAVSFSRKISGYLTGSSQTSQFQPCPQPPVVGRETPFPSNRIGQPALTHHCAECLKTCF